MALSGCLRLLWVAVLAGLEAVAYTGRYELELERPGSGQAGLVVNQTKHTDYEVRCACGHSTRAALGNINLRQTHSQTLQALWNSCVRVAGWAYPEQAKLLARELLNDWDSFWVVLDHPHLPLTNNEAERALRPWVILRRVSHGTRTEQGSRAFCALVSVIDTCRKRGLSPWSYLTDALRRRRQGLPAPALPLVA